MLRDERPVVSPPHPPIFARQPCTYYLAPGHERCDVFGRRAFHVGQEGRIAPREQVGHLLVREEGVVIDARRVEI